MTPIQRHTSPLPIWQRYEEGSVEGRGGQNDCVFFRDGVVLPGSQYSRPSYPLQFLTLRQLWVPPSVLT